MDSMMILQIAIVGGIALLMGLALFEKWLREVGAAEWIIKMLIGLPICFFIGYSAVVKPAYELVAVTYYAFTGDYLPELP